MQTPDTTTELTISRDGEKITTVTGEFEVLRYFRYHPYSLYHAVTYEGYAITDPNGKHGVLYTRSSN